MNANRRAQGRFLLSVQMAVVYLPGLQQASKTVPLSSVDWFICPLVGSSDTLVGDLLKAVRNRRGETKACR